MSLAVTLDEAKAYLRIGSSSADALVQALADGAEDWVQEFCGVQFGEARRTDFLDGGRKNLWLTRRPLRQVVSVQDREQPDAAIVADVDYFVVGDRLLKRRGGMYGAWMGRMQQVAERWAEGEGRWVVTYDCGFQTPPSADASTTAGADGQVHYPLPAGLKVAVLELTRRAVDNRGGVTEESAAGWRVQWQEFAGSDILQILAPYMRLDG